MAFGYISPWWASFIGSFGEIATKHNYTSSPTEEEMHGLLETIKRAMNDEIDHNPDIPQAEKEYAKSYNESLQKSLEELYHQCVVR